MPADGFRAYRACGIPRARYRANGAPAAARKGRNGRPRGSNRCQNRCQTTSKCVRLGASIEGFDRSEYENLGAESGSRTRTRLPSAVFETAKRVFVVVRRRSLEYENQPRVGSSVRHRTPKFALTAVKLLSARVCWHTMKRTTVKISDDLDARLRHEAERRGVTVSELTRQAIEKHLVEGGKRRLGAAGRSGRATSPIGSRRFSGQSSRPADRRRRTSLRGIRR